MRTTMFLTAVVALAGVLLGQAQALVSLAHGISGARITGWPEWTRTAPVEFLVIDSIERPAPN